MASQQTGSQSRYQDEAGTFLTIMDEMAPQIRLDYSVESLQRLDQFITEHFDPPGSKFVAETLPVGIGCYVGEVIIRHLGGHWNKEGKAEVNAIGPVDAVFPIDKALKRFTEGREHSLAWYYHSIQKHAYEAEHGIAPKNEEAAEPPVPANSAKDGGLLGFIKGLFGGK